MSIRSSISTLAVLTAGAFQITGCGGTAGAQPHDMTAAQHEAMASKEESSAAGHTEKYEPTAEEKKESCTPAKRVCWASVENPTAEHAKDAADHRKAAADHRAAAQALRDAEAKSCAGIPDDDRDLSPFYHREDISDVKPHMAEMRPGKKVGQKTIGAEITFRAVPGMTVEWLQRIVDCHIARAASVGAMPDMAYCPLMPKDVVAKVSSTGNGFTVTVTSENAESAAEIVKRANALVAK